MLARPGPRSTWVGAGQRENYKGTRPRPALGFAPPGVGPTSWLVC